MELNQILKGMPNAAEAIEQNFSRLASEVVAYGSNANGNFIKLYDGTMICWMGYLGTQVQTGGALGAIFQSGGSNWTFPATFINTPNLFIGVRRISGSTAWGGHSGEVTATEATALRVMSPTNTTIGVLQPVAIGRWK